MISPSVATIIESIPGFASNADGDASKGKFAFGIQKMGQMNSRYDVYKNPYMTENVIFLWVIEEINSLKQALYLLHIFL